MTRNEFIQFYYKMDYLPINSNVIEEVFYKLMKDMNIKKDYRTYQWEFAELLIDDNLLKFAYYLNDFIEKIENENNVVPKIIYHF